MGMEKPIRGSGKNGYIYPDGTVRNEYLVKQRPETDDNGLYVLIHGRKNYVADLVADHFGGKAAKSHPKTVEIKPPEKVMDGGGEQEKSGDSEPKQVEIVAAPEVVSEGSNTAEEPVSAEPDEGDAGASNQTSEPAPAEEAPEQPEPKKVSSEDEISLIADIFRENPDFTYAQIIQSMLKKGYKVTRNQIAEGKRQAGLIG